MVCDKKSRVRSIVKRAIYLTIVCAACVAMIVSMLLFPMFKMSHEDVPVMMLEDAGQDGMLGTKDISKRDQTLLDNINSTTYVMFFVITAIAVGIIACSIFKLRIPAFVLSVVMIIVLYVLHYLVTTDYTEMLNVFKIREVSPMIGSGEGITVCLWSSYICAYATLVSMLKRNKK